MEGTRFSINLQVVIVETYPLSPFSGNYLSSIWFVVLYDLDIYTKMIDPVYVNHVFKVKPKANSKKTMKK